MANIRKKIINKWDTGITTSPRDSNPETSSGAQMIKGFDIYKDSKKLIPMQSWTSFTTDAEKAYNIRAMGGFSDNVYGLGYGLSNWYGNDWQYRLKIYTDSGYNKGQDIPYRIDMSSLPQDFWDNVKTDGSDIRIVDKNNTILPFHFEDFDHSGQQGDLWLPTNSFDTGDQPINVVASDPTTASSFSITHTGSAYAVAWQIVLTGQTFNELFLAVGSITGATQGDLIVDLYTDSSGSPGTLVENLGSMNLEVLHGLGSSNKDIRIAFSDKTYTGTYQLVLRCPTADGSNYYNIEYLNTGDQTIRSATNSGLTSWSTVDGSSTPYYKLSFANRLDSYCYIYYGNPDAPATSVYYGTSGFTFPYNGRTVFSSNSMRIAYTFGEQIPRNLYYNNLEVVGGTEAFQTDPIYVDGYSNNAIKTYGVSVTTNSDDGVGLSGNDIQISFMLKTSAWENVDLIKSGNGHFTISLDTNGKIKFFVDGSSGNTTSTSTRTIGLNQWHLIHCIFNHDQYVYIDGVLETFYYSDGDYDGDTINETLILNTGAFCSLSNIFAFDNDVSSQNSVDSYMESIFRNDFFTFGAQENISEIPLNYTGVQLYKKSILSGDWEEEITLAHPIRNLSYFPVNAFVEDSGAYFVVSGLDNNSGFGYLAHSGYPDIIDPTHLSLGFLLLSSQKVVIQSSIPIDGTQYFNIGSSALASVGDPGSIAEFTAVSTIQSIVPWRTYLAIGSNRRNIGYINIWDLSSSLSTEKVTTGTGNLRIVGNASDTLFCVVDNFTNDAVKSSNKPTVEIKQYIGNGEMQTTHILEVPAIVTDYDDDWEMAVSNFKIQRNTQTLFYARIPTNKDATEFNEGFWSIGKNSSGELVLALQISTSGLGMPENVFGFAQQIFFIQKDGGIMRLSDDTYTDVSLFTTLKMNEGNTEIEKKLIGVELVTESLPEGQTFSLYYRRIHDETETSYEDSRIKILDFTGEGKNYIERTFDENENNLPLYNEIEFDIESTGGSACLLEFSYRYEVLNEGES